LFSQVQFSFDILKQRRTKYLIDIMFFKTLGNATLILFQTSSTA